MRPYMRLTVVLMAVTALSAPSFVSTGVATGEEPTMEKQFTSEQGIRYEVAFDTKTHVLEIHSQNPTKSYVESSVVVSVDQTTVEDVGIRLEPEGGSNHRIKVGSDLDALETEHTVSISTFGAHKEFNFSYQVDFENPDGVKVPRITNASIGTAQVDGKPSAVVNVTVLNPSVQTYPTKLMVHTRGTGGSFYAAIVRPGESETITVELLDERGAEIAGEARLYAGELDESDGGIDQVGFVGRTGEDTTTWNESYEPVAAPWSDDPYQYRNDSIDTGRSVAERASGGHEIGGVPLVYPALGMICLGAALVRLR